MRKVVHPRFPDYLIRDDGFVERVVDGNSSKRGNILRGYVGKVSGYRRFKLIDANAKKVMINANKLICEAFHGPAPSPAHQAAHENGVRLENRPDNLSWKTPLENTHDMVRHGTVRNGEQAPKAKLTAESVIAIRLAFDNKRGTAVRLAERYGVSKEAIYKVVKSKSWAHLPACPRRSADAR